jgi:hypothetical protein
LEIGGSNPNQHHAFYDLSPIKWFQLSAPNNMIDLKVEFWPKYTLKEQLRAFGNPDDCILNFQIDTKQSKFLFFNMSELGMDIPYLRSLMLNHKVFIKNLYTGNNLMNLKTIDNANDRQLNIVVRILHLIANGVIPMKAAQFSVVKDSKKFKLLRDKFESSASFNKQDRYRPVSRLL